MFVKTERERERDTEREVERGRERIRKEGYIPIEEKRGDKRVCK